MPSPPRGKGPRDKPRGRGGKPGGKKARPKQAGAKKTRDARPAPPEDPDAIVLGRPARAHKLDVLRDGAIRVRSRHGLREAERLLIGALPAEAGSGLLTILDKEAVVAIAFARLHPGAAVRHFALDAYVAAEAQRTIARCEPPPAVEVVVGADPAWAGDTPPDVIAMAAPENALLARELIEAAHDLLPIGGRLLLAAKRPPKEVVRLAKEVFGKADLQKSDGKFHLVHARRRREEPQHKDRRRLLERDVEGTPIVLATRPGVFKWTGIDAGARALLAIAAVTKGERVLDLGCGHGVIGAVLGLRGASGGLLVDSDARAAEAARETIARNGLAGFEALRSGDLSEIEAGAFDLVVANPPYFGEYRIAEAFLRAGARAMKPDGCMLLVAKRTKTVEELAAEAFASVEVEEQDGYGVVLATNPRTDTTG